jgi:GrpB protein
VAYDAAWPATYGVVRGRIVDALGDAALAIEHIGSTSVSGLAAKPWGHARVQVPPAQIRWWWGGGAGFTGQPPEPARHAVAHRRVVRESAVTR